MAKTPTSPHTVTEIEIALIDIPVSARPLNEQHAEELACLIHDHGLQNPITIYENGDAPGRYVLGPGRHRLRAYELLGRTKIPAFVKAPAPEHEIRTAQAIENLGRADLTPMEEAASLQALIECAAPDAGGEDEQETISTIASMIGRPQKWVENRLALLRLSPRVQQMLLDGKIFLSHAQLLARLAKHETQEEIAGRLGAHKNKWSRHENPPESMYRWTEAVERELRTLRGVPWKLDVEFAGKPACNGCPNNSANAAGLFDGDAPKKQQCLNAACYAVKTKAASSAVVKASNTLVKLTNEGDVKVSPKGAAKAIEERGVDFIETKAVLQRAKKQQQPNKKTKAERTGAGKNQAEWDARAKFRKACSAWNSKAEKAILAAIKTPASQLAMVLLSESCNWWTLDGKSGRKKFSDALKPAAAVAKIAVLAPELIELVGHAFKKNHRSLFHHGSVWGFQQIIDALKIDFTEPAPEWNDFKPKPAKKKTTKKKKKVAKRSAAKAATSSKRNRPKESTPRVCRECGCTDSDCSKCIEATGEPCYWVKPDLCSRCAAEAPANKKKRTRKKVTRKKKPSGKAKAGVKS